MTQPPTKAVIPGGPEDRGATRVIHVYPELRAEHLDRFAAWGPGDIVLYRRLKWDLKTVSEGSRFQRLTLGTLKRSLRGQDVVIVEVPEPLWMRELAFTVIVAGAVRMSKGRRARLVTYCIENSALPALVGYAGPLRTLAVWLVMEFVALTIGRLLDRVVYGSPGSQATYSDVPGFARLPSRVILELPSPEEEITDADTSGVLFVGRLEHRKGVLRLLSAWREVEDSTDSTITIVGDGPLAGDVAQWVAERPERRAHIPDVEHSSIGDVYRAHRVLAAPSVRDGRWREQIGLPIKEALSYGLTIVTTTETGLADWLAKAGHSVIDDVSLLAEALRAAIASPLTPSAVVQQLPTHDGRVEADKWMRQQ